MNVKRRTHLRAIGDAVLHESGGTRDRFIAEVTIGRGDRDGGGMRDTLKRIPASTSDATRSRIFRNIPPPLPNYPSRVGFGFSGQTWPNWDVTSNRVDRLTKRSFSRQKQSLKSGPAFIGS